MLEIYSDNTEDKIKILFTTVNIIRACNDAPVLWKLNTEFLDVLCRYMRICSHDKLTEEKFLDAGIDITSNTPYCLSYEKCYPLIKV